LHDGIYFTISVDQGAKLADCALFLLAETRDIAIDLRDYRHYLRGSQLLWHSSEGLLQNWV